MALSSKTNYNYLTYHLTDHPTGAMASPLALVSPASLPGWVIAFLAALEFVFLLYAYRHLTTVTLLPTTSTTYYLRPTTYYLPRTNY